MLKGFKEFLLRGNVIDLAVAVVIGASFTAIVNALVEGILNPVLLLIFDADSLSQAGVILREASGDQAAVILSWGRVTSAIIQFLLIATVVYFALIVPMNHLKKVAFRKRETAKEPAPEVPSETDLLVEIRDLLRAQNAATPGADENPPFNSGGKPAGPAG